MPDYIVCTRAIKGGSFPSEPGPERFLKVPDQQTAAPSQEINRTTLIEEMKMIAPASSSKARRTKLRHRRAAENSAPSQRCPEFMLQHAKLLTASDHATRCKLKLEHRPSPQVTGSGVNPRIVAYHPSTSLNAPSASNDETPWYSSFVNWCVERSGQRRHRLRMGPLLANLGPPPTSPTRGCITVFERGTGSGHVAFFISRTDSKIKVLGGNQSDEVRISEYPASRLLGFRVPV